MVIAYVVAISAMPFRISPFLFKNASGFWQCLWSMNDEDQIALSSTPDLISCAPLLANLLPVTVTSEFDPSVLNISNGEAILTLLPGNPEVGTAKPMSSKIAVSETFQYEIPPYSFSVIIIE